MNSHIRSHSSIFITILALILTVGSIGGASGAQVYAYSLQTQAAASASGTDETGCTIVIDGNQVSFDESSGQPFVDENDRTLVPLRRTMESYGCSVAWNQDTHTAWVTLDSDTVVVGIGNNYIFANGTMIKTDAAARLINGRIYLPIRAVLEAMGADVKWEDSTRTVRVISGRSDSVAMTAEQIYEKCAPAVFYIQTYDENGKANTIGSGFFIDSSGTAVTNYHVIKDCYAVRATTLDGKRYSVEGVYDYDEEKDTALLKVKGSDFPWLEMGNSDTLKEGASIYTIGSPLGLTGTISSGIISSADREYEARSFIQITAPISGGSSGGALLNVYGKVIGITCGSFINENIESQNLNLAVPINDISELTADSLLIKYKG